MGLVTNYLNDEIIPVYLEVRRKLIQWAWNISVFKKNWFTAPRAARAPQNGMFPNSLLRCKSSLSLSPGSVFCFHLCSVTPRGFFPPPSHKLAPARGLAAQPLVTGWLLCWQWHLCTGHCQQREHTESHLEHTWAVGHGQNHSRTATGNQQRH